MWWSYHTPESHFISCILLLNFWLAHCLPQWWSLSLLHGSADVFHLFAWDWYRYYDHNAHSYPNKFGSNLWWRCYLHGWFCFGNTTSKVRLDLGDESNLWEEYRSVTLVSWKGLLVFLNKHFLIFCKTLATPRALIYFYMILSSFIIALGEICWVTHSILSNILQKCLSLFLPTDLCYFWWL